MADRGYIDRRKRYEVVEYDPVLALLHVKKSEQEARYRHYVESELAGTDQEFVKLMKENPQAIEVSGNGREPNTRS